MSHHFPSLANLFTTWASTGSYGPGIQSQFLEGFEQVRASNDATQPAPRKAGLRRTARQHVELTGFSAEPKYIDGAMLIRHRPI